MLLPDLKFSSKDFATVQLYVYRYCTRTRRMPEPQLKLLLVTCNVLE